tara:strand:- start:2410 stop:2796 length:387 start_codon:yes stop_codon:yes gene_type:complete
MEDNKLIAEFMGCTYPHNEITDATLYNVSHGTFELSELRYDVSWDWLMPVVHKCYQEHTCSQERMNSNDAYEIKTCDITRVYKAVVKFIKGQEVMDIHAQYSFYIECCVDEAEGEIALSFEEWKQLNN